MSCLLISISLIQVYLCNATATLQSSYIMKIISDVPNSFILYFQRKKKSTVQLRSGLREDNSHWGVVLATDVLFWAFN